MSTDDRETGTENEGNSLMDNLKGTGEAWRAAGSALGDAVSGFAKNFREDRNADTVPGAHSLSSDVEDADGVAKKLRVAVDNARGALNSADNDRDFRAAATSFASDAENILKDLAGSVSRAGGATVESGKADQVKERVSTALGEVRETITSAVSDLRNRSEESDVDAAGDDGGAKGTVDDLRARLDNLLSRVSAQFDSDSEEQDVVIDHTPDIIDGEVVETVNPENS